MKVEIFHGKSIGSSGKLPLPVKDYPKKKKNDISLCNRWRTAFIRAFIWPFASYFDANKFSWRAVFRLKKKSRLTCTWHSVLSTTKQGSIATRRTIYLTCRFVGLRFRKRSKDQIIVQFLWNRNSLRMYSHAPRREKLLRKVLMLCKKRRIRDSRLMHNYQ